jgi:hypothetical protein
MKWLEALVGIGMQNVWVRNPRVEQWVETLPAHLRALTATDENAPPQSAYATPEDAQLTGVSGQRMVLVVALHDLPEPCADLTRTSADRKCKRNPPHTRSNAPLSRSSADARTACQEFQ